MATSTHYQSLLSLLGEHLDVDEEPTDLINALAAYVNEAAANGGGTAEHARIQELEAEVAAKDDEIAKLKASSTKTKVKVARKGSGKKSGPRAANAYSLFVKTVSGVKKGEHPAASYEFTPATVDPSVPAAKKFDYSTVEERAYTLSDLVSLTAEAGITNLMSQASVVWAMTPPEARDAIKAL